MSSYHSFHGMARGGKSWFKVLSTVLCHESKLFVGQSRLLLTTDNE